VPDGLPPDGRGAYSHPMGETGLSRPAIDRRSGSPAQDALAKELRIYQKIARISRTLLCLDHLAIEKAVREELASAADLAQADRAFFIFVDYARSPTPWTCSWPTEDEAPPHPIEDSDAFAWSRRELIAGKLVHVPSLDVLPAEASEERNRLEARGVRSLVTFPLHPGDEMYACLVFERIHQERSWSEEELRSLSLLGEVFANAMRRRQTEGTLRESEERFRTITEEATELVAEFDSKGRYCYVSPSYEVKLGYTPESLLGQSTEKLIHPDDNRISREKFERSFRQSVPSHSIHRLRHRNGEWRWYENSGRAYRGADGLPRFVSIGIDITERVEAQQALERQLELERSVARLSRRLLGLREDELGDEIIRSLEDTAQLTGADRAYLGNFSSGPGDRGSFSEWYSDRMTQRSPGPSTWGREAIRSGVMLHYPDIADLPPEALIERATLEGRGVRSILSIPVRSGDVVSGVIGFECLEPRTWSEDEIILLRLIGEILMSARRRQAMELALRESQLQLAQSQKLEAVGRLAGGIAHDFNNLLTVILGLSRPILRDLEAGSELHVDIEDIHDAAERAAALTRQLLTFSRRQPFEERVVDLNSTLRALRPLLSRILGEDIQLEYDLLPAKTWVRGDPHQFDQVVVNLAANARDAMPTGGSVHVGTALCEPDAAQIARLRLPGAGCYVVIGFSDTGEGMDERTQRHIFDPFYTTKEPGKGTGLGLSIVYSVIEQATGAIEVESAPAKGTRFQLWLPAASEEAAPHQSAPDPTSGVGSERVLFVEDEPAVRRLGRRILERAGYEVIEARDGEEALALVTSETTPVDIVVTDVIMPNLGGGEMARRLRALRPDLPILFVSGHPEDREGTLELEGTDLLRKPFTADALLARLRTLLDREAS